MQIRFLKGNPQHEGSNLFLFAFYSAGAGAWPQFYIRPKLHHTHIHSGLQGLESERAKIPDKVRSIDQIPH